MRVRVPLRAQLLSLYVRRSALLLPARSASVPVNKDLRGGAECLLAYL